MIHCIKLEGEGTGRRAQGTMVLVPTAAPSGGEGGRQVADGPWRAAQPRFAMVVPSPSDQPGTLCVIRV